jgi:muramoyltetrapeptide carboxypeptidase LdcA involved in peptidoglycan recycling
VISAAEPTWVIGYSDSSTWMTPLTLRAGLATLHGDNLADTPNRPLPGLVHWTDFAIAVAPETVRASLISTTMPRRTADRWMMA